MYPSTFSAFNRPTSTDRLNNPSHSALHNTQSSAIGQLEAVIGLATSSTLGSLMYDIRSPDSNGGGHIQTANKGGTGQVTYTKGDLLVASSPSVLTKLAVGGTTGDSLRVDPTSPVGVSWGNPTGNKLVVSPVSSSVVSTTDETVLFAASIIGSVLGVSNAIKFSGYLSKLTISNDTLTIRTKYGPNTISSMTTGANGPIIFDSQGLITGTIVANASSVLQKGFGQLYTTNMGMGVSSSIISTAAYGTSSVQSTAPQDLVVTAQWSATRGSIVGQMFVVERIA